jgi:hypothetical protein
LSSEFIGHPVIVKGHKRLDPRRPVSDFNVQRMHKRPFGRRHLCEAPQEMLEVPMAQTLLERFESFYIPEPNSGCWIWTGVISRAENGYGLISVNGSKRGAHRVSYELHHGPIVNGQFVLHRCDTPCCVNPDHLFSGTQAVNAADKIAKGRDPRGEKNGQAKLTEDDVKAIRKDARTLAAIACDYGISETCVSEVKRRVWWKHVE